MKKSKLYLPIILAALFVFWSCGDSAEETATDIVEDFADGINDALNDGIDNAQTAGEKFFSKDGKFKIIFSGEPTLTKENVPVEGVGNFDMFMYIYEMTSKAEMIAYIDYPPELINEVNNDQMLQDAKQGTIGSLSMTISEEEKLDFKGNDALRYRADNGQLYVDYLIFLVGNRFFQVAIMTEWSYPAKDEVDKFFDSIELLHE